MHFYGVFRKVELDRNQLVGKAELQRREHMSLTGRKVDQRLLGLNLAGAASLVGCEYSGAAGFCLYRLEAQRFILSNNRQRPVDPTGKNKAQSGDGDLDWN